MVALLLGPGCGEDGDPATDTAADDGSGDSGSSDGQGSGSGPAAEGDDSIRGTFVFIDGTEEDLDVSANYRRFEFGGVVQHACEGSDIQAGLSLGVNWRDDTPLGSHAPSLSDGPGFIAAWPQADGDGVRGTLPSGGELTFESIGTEPGDVVEGTARAILSPDADDPNDRVAEIVEIEFRCVVADAE